MPLVDDVGVGEAGIASYCVPFQQVRVVGQKIVMPVRQVLWIVRRPDHQTQDRAGGTQGPLHEEGCAGAAAALTRPVTWARKRRR